MSSKRNLSDRELHEAERLPKVSHTDLPNCPIAARFESDFKFWQKNAIIQNYKSAICLHYHSNRSLKPLCGVLIYSMWVNVVLLLLYWLKLINY